MATDETKRYFARAWENGAGPCVSEPWRHDYTRNVLAFVAALCFAEVVLPKTLGALQWILLSYFPALAQYWCIVHKGMKMSRLDGHYYTIYGCIMVVPFLSRFGPLLVSVRQHWWFCQMISVVMWLTVFAVIFLVLATTVTVCWIGDKMLQLTGWRSDNQCRSRGHCALDDCTCAQYSQSTSQMEKTFDTEGQGQSSTSAIEKHVAGATPEQTHYLPPFGRNGERLYGARDHYSKHPHNPALLGAICHTPMHGRPNYAEYIRNLIQSPVVESPLPDHVAIHHGPCGAEAFHTITARPEHQNQSQEELRLKHYQEQKEQVKADSERVVEKATEGTGTSWLRARQFANSIFSNSTSTTASRDSFGRSSLGRRGLLIDVEDGNDSAQETTPLVEKGTPRKMFS